MSNLIDAKTGKPSDKMLGKYEIPAQDGHVFDSAFTASSHAEAISTLKQIYRRLRQSNVKLKRRIYYLLGDDLFDEKSKWITIKI